MTFHYLLENVAHRRVVSQVAADPEVDLGLVAILVQRHGDHEFRVLGRASRVGSAVSETADPRPATSQRDLTKSRNQRIFHHAVEH